MLSTFLLSALLLGADDASDPLAHWSIAKRIADPADVLSGVKLRIAEASLGADHTFAITTRETVFVEHVAETLDTYPVRLPNGKTEFRWRSDKHTVKLPFVQTLRLAAPWYLCKVWRGGKPLEDEEAAGLFKQPRQVVVVERLNVQLPLDPKVLALFRPETVLVTVQGVGKGDIRWEAEPLNRVSKERLIADRNSIKYLNLSGSRNGVSRNGVPATGSGLNYQISLLPTVREDGTLRHGTPTTHRFSECRLPCHQPWQWAGDHLLE